MARHSRIGLLAPLQERILALMLMRPSREWYRSELARELGVSPSSLQRPLAGLIRAGVVVARPDGNRLYYGVDTSHPILPELKGLLAKTSGIAGGKARRGRAVEQRAQSLSPEVVQHMPEVEQFCRRFRVRRLELFGSAATGQDSTGQSDLDFLVDFESLPSGSFADSYFGLLESLEQLFGRHVDLVFASAIKNPYFRQAIEPTRVLLYAA
jgi:predicted nucleotidyltransferase